MSDQSDIQAKAVEIAKRGVAEVQVGDRRHRFSDPNLLLDVADRLNADALDATFGGMLPVTFQDPT